MAATLSDLATISKDTNFQSRVAMAVMTAAVNVYSELSNTAGHPARVAYSKQVFNGGGSPSAPMMVLTNSTIAASANVAATPTFSIVDSDIQVAVNSLWNDLAGV